MVIKDGELTKIFFWNIKEEQCVRAARDRKGSWHRSLCGTAYMSSVSIVWCCTSPTFRCPSTSLFIPFIYFPASSPPSPSNPPPPTRIRLEPPLSFAQSVPPHPWAHCSIDVTPPSLNVRVCLPLHHHWPVWPLCPRCCSIHSFDLLYQGKTKSGWLACFFLSRLCFTPTLFSSILPRLPDLSKFSSFLFALDKAPFPFCELPSTFCLHSPGSSLFPALVPDLYLFYLSLFLIFLSLFMSVALALVFLPISLFLSPL